jgi:hypothetical protein
MSRNRNMLCEISRVECCKKLLSSRIVRIIQMKVEIASDEKFVGSGHCSEKIRKRKGFARFSGGRRRSIDIEDS